MLENFKFQKNITCETIYIYTSRGKYVKKKNLFNNNKCTREQFKYLFTHTYNVYFFVQIHKNLQDNRNFTIKMQVTV